MIKYEIIGTTTIAMFADERNRRNDTVWYWQLCDELIKINNDFLDDTIIRNLVEKHIDRITKFYAIAKCEPTDIFNEEYGKNLAKKRLLKKFDKIRLAILSDYYEFLNNQATVQKAKIMIRVTKTITHWRMNNNECE